MSNFEFQDILNMQYPNPEIEKDFPDKILRAAQFAPFAALIKHIRGRFSCVDKKRKI